MANDNIELAELMREQRYERQRQAAKEKRKIFVYDAGCPPECKQGDSGGAVRKFDKVGRNDPCPCGSGAKYKKCCVTYPGYCKTMAARKQASGHSS